MWLDYIFKKTDKLKQNTVETVYKKCMTVDIFILSMFNK